MADLSKKGDDHALTTATAIPKGDGSTQVASLLTDDGTTVSNAGDTDLSAGQTKVGAFGGRVQTVTATGTIGTLALDDDATIVEFTNSSTAVVQGVSGGWPGRCVMFLANGSGVVQIQNEVTSGVVAGDRIRTGNANSWNARPPTNLMLCYSGATSRWIHPTSYEMALLNVGNSINTGSITVSATGTFNGNAILGNNDSDALTVNAHGANVAIPIGRQIFTTSGTYTPTTGTYRVRVRMVGGGGGGGGATGAANVGAGGGAGGYVEAWIDPGAAITGGTVTIGTGGAGGDDTGAYPAGFGVAGGDTSAVIQGTTYTAGGGGGGAGSAAPSATALTAGGSAGAALSFGDVVAAGAPGSPGIKLSASLCVSGSGGSGPFGGGGGGVTAGASGWPATNGTGYGSGGSGGSGAASTGYAGGDGAPGLVIIEEYR